jgi:hypothetical protein
MKNHVPAKTRILEPSSRFCIFCMSLSFFAQLPGHVPLISPVPSGRPEIEPCKKSRVPHDPRDVPANPQTGHGVPLSIRGAYVPVGRFLDLTVFSDSQSLLG